MSRAKDIVLHNTKVDIIYDAEFGVIFNTDNQNVLSVLCD